MNTVPVPVKIRYVYDQLGSPVWWSWCQNTFGPPNDSQYGKPATVHYWRLEPGLGYRMWFADPAHATMFRMKWS